MVNFNGDLLPETAHFLNHTNRGLRYGDAVFETLRHSGGSLLFWEDHYFRLMASMRQLRMEIPMDFDMEFAADQIGKTLAASGLEGRPARIRLTVFRDSAGFYTPEDRGIKYIVETAALETGGYVAVTDPCRTELFKDYYIQADSLAGLKHANRLLQVLAGIYARENGYGTCILLNHRKEVAEAGSGNIFARFGNTLRTPPLGSGCLDGILRKQILRLSAGAGFPYAMEEAVISPFDLQQADELFYTNVIAGIRPVTAYRKADYSREAAGLLTGLLNAQIETAGNG